MQLIFSLSTVIAVQLFWFSVVLIGYIFNKVLQKRFGKKFITNWKELPFAGKFLISVATAFVYFSLMTVVGYIFKLPGVWLSIIYLGGLVSSFLLAIFYVRKDLLQDFNNVIKAIKNIKFFSAVSFLIILVIFDYVLTQFMGTFLSGDAPIHMSKLRHLHDVGFTLEDAVFGGMPETRHHISVLHTLLAIPQQFGIRPEASWYLAAGFLKLVKASAIYFLAFTISDRFKRASRHSFAATVTIFGITFFSNYAITMPFIFAATWSMLFLVSLFYVVSGKNHWLLIMTSLLLATTHSLDSMGALLLLGFIGLGLLIFDRKSINRQLVFTGLASGFILSTTPIFSALLPNQMSKEAFNAASTLFDFIHLGQMEAFKPTLFQFSQIRGSLILDILALIGMASLIFVLTKKNQKIVAICTLIFGPLIVNNPPVFNLLKKIVPPWAIDRLSNANQLYVVFVPLGIINAFYISLMIMKKLSGFIPPLKTFSKKLTDPNISKWSVGLMVVIVIALVPICNSFNSMQRKEPGAPLNYYQTQNVLWDRIEAIREVAPNEPQAVVMANNFDSIMLPTLGPTHVLAIKKSHATPASDADNRSACQDLIQRNFYNSSLLKQAGVNYVLVQKNSTPDKFAQKNSDLTPYKQTKNKILYKFNGQNVVAGNNNLCTFNE